MPGSYSIPCTAFRTIYHEGNARTIRLCLAMDDNILRFITSATDCSNRQRHIRSTGQSAWSTMVILCSVQVDDAILSQMEAAAAESGRFSTIAVPDNSARALVGYTYQLSTILVAVAAALASTSTVFLERFAQ